MKALEETRLRGELEPLKALLIQQTAIIHKKDEMSETNSEHR